MMNVQSWNCSPGMLGRRRKIATRRWPCWLPLNLLAGVYSMPLNLLTGGYSMPPNLLFSLGLAIWDRCREPSSHAGLALLAQAFKQFVPAEYAPVADAAAGLFASLAVVLAERGQRES